MHYLGKEQPFIRGKRGLFSAVWLVPAQAGIERESREVTVTACLSIGIAMILVWMGMGISCRCAKQAGVFQPVQVRPR
jgi:hypothetical protein